MMKWYVSFFSLFLILLSLSCSQISDINSTKTIAIQPYGKVDVNHIDTVAKSLEKVYDANVIVLEQKEIPKEAYTNIKSPRYRADELLKILMKEKNDSIHYVLGITNYDISTTKRDESGKIKEPEHKYKDWGIFGLGFCPGPTCIVSTYRLKNTSNHLFIERLIKISIHEVGHNYGLPHCQSSENCVMRDAAESISTIDNVKSELCVDCKNKIGIF